LRVRASVRVDVLVCVGVGVWVRVCVCIVARAIDAVGAKICSLTKGKNKVWKVQTGECMNTACLIYK
jgi:hypothetical protein